MARSSLCLALTMHQLSCSPRSRQKPLLQIAFSGNGSHVTLYHGCVQVFSDAPDDARWIVPIHHVVVHNLVTTAIQADEAQKQSTTGASGKLSDAATYLQSSVFSDTLRKGEKTQVLAHLLSSPCS